MHKFIIIAKIARQHSRLQLLPLLHPLQEFIPGLKYSFLVSIMTGEGICLLRPLLWKSLATFLFTSIIMSLKCSVGANSNIVSVKALTNHDPYSELRHDT